MHAFLNTAIRAAREAGKIISQNISQIDRLTIEYKEKNDLVSEVDRRAEESIVEIITKYYPDHVILGEEGGLIKPKAAKSDKTADMEKNKNEVVWIVDPLDGTTNFLHGYPRFAVSIGIQMNGRIEHGVIYDPVMDELFTASRGQGARLNDSRIRVSKSNSLESALIGMGFPFRRFDDLQTLLDLLAEMIPLCHGVRRGGAASLDLANVACGRLDGYWEAGLQPWDIAAGSVIVREAGGIAADFNGEGDFLASGNIITATPKVYAQMHKLIKKHLL